METLSIIKAVEQIAQSQAVWSICCILIVAYVFWHTNKQEAHSNNREVRLLDSLDAITKTQQDLANTQKDQAQTMQVMSKSLDNLQVRMDHMERRTYNPTRKEDE